MTRYNSRHWLARNAVGVKAKNETAAKSSKQRRSPVVDREAFAAITAQMDDLAAQPRPAVIGGHNVLPATGRCHECDRQISGERRFCGRCMSKRRT